MRFEGVSFIDLYTKYDFHWKQEITKINKIDQLLNTLLQNIITSGFFLFAQNIFNNLNNKFTYLCLTSNVYATFLFIYSNGFNN